MEKMQLVVLDFYEYRETFPLWSIVFVKVNDQCFPDSEWWDATSDLLEMWITNVCGLLCGSREMCTLDFLDGDYSIKLTVEEAPGALVECLNPQGKIVLTERIDLFYFARQILAAVGKLTSHYSNNLNARNIQCLIREADRLRHLLHKLKKKTD